VTPEESRPLLDRRFFVFPVDHPDLKCCVGVRTDSHDPATCTERGKHPAVRFTKKATNDFQAIATELSVPRNLGIFCGKSNILVIDEDKDGEFQRYADERNVEIPRTYTVRTGKGRHYYFRPSDGTTFGNTEGEFCNYSCNVRAGNAYVVAPGSMHATGVRYTVEDDTADIAELPQWVVDGIRAYPRRRPKSCGPLSDEGRRGLETMPEVLRGPRADDSGERHGWLVRYACSLRARSIPIAEAEAPYKAVWRRCEQPPTCTTALSWNEAMGKLNDVYFRYPSGHSEIDSDSARDKALMIDGAALAPTWGPIDLRAFLSGDILPTVPTLLPRDDGLFLLYPGLVNSIYGESESGKSLLIQAEAARIIMSGQKVLFIDNESDPKSVVERMRAFGATEEAITEYFHYVRPEASINSPVEAAAFEALLGDEYALVAIDGVTDALGLFGYSTVDNDNVARWFKDVPKKLASRTGAGVVLVDHVTKNPHDRGRFAIGAQAKLAEVTGAAYIVEVVQPLGRGCTGVIKLWIAKDRPGAVRHHCGAPRKADRTQLASIIEVASQMEGLTVINAAAPSDDVTAPPRNFRPTSLMESVSAYVELGRRPGKRDILRAVGGHKPAVELAIAFLVEEVYVRVEKKSARHEHVSVKPYVQVDDPLSDRYSGGGDDQ